MRILFGHLILLSMIALTAGLAQEKVPPASLVLKAKNGDVIFDHAAHAKREKNACAACHPSLWPQDAKAPLKFSANMHRTAEEKRSSCGSCHRDGGAAFTTKGNCTSRCHVKAAVPKAAPKKG